LFFCHGRDSGASCKNGWWPGEAYEEFKNKGVVDEACYPYDLSKQDCSMLCSDWQSRIVKITGFSDLTNRPQDIKAWISAKGPVSGCLIVYQDFFVYKSGVYKHVSGSKCGGHCVAIVGYNDSPGYWICKNSWGTNWGELGFFRIAYGQCAIETWRNHSVHGIARNLR